MLNLDRYGSQADVSRCTVPASVRPVLVHRMGVAWWRAVVVGALFALLAALPVRAQDHATLRGFVKDVASGLPFQNVNVVLHGPDSTLYGAATNRDGYYQIGQIPAGRYILSATYVGYEPYADTLRLRAGEIRTLSFDLTASEQALDEVVVEAEGGAAAVAGGLQTVRVGDIARIPTPDVSGDLAAYLQSLPGIVTVGDRGGQLYVRGGEPSENLVLMDGILVYQPFHVVGFFSAFPEDLVSFAEVHAGGFGARFSGRTSSVIDVAMRNGNKKRYQGSVSAAPFITSAMVEGPIGSSEKLSFIGSVRQSVIRETSPTLVGHELPFRFSDQYAKLHADVRDDGQLSITALNTYDRGTIDPNDPDDEAITWKNSAVGARYLMLPERYPILGEFLLSTSFVENTAGSPIRPARTSTARQYNTEANITHYLRHARLTWGLRARLVKLDFLLSGQFQNLESGHMRSIEAGLFVDADVDLSPRLKINPGVAVNTYSATSTVTVEPRFRMTYRPGGPYSRHSFNVAGGFYTQTILGVTDERDAGSAFVAWMRLPLGNDEEGAWHAIAGWQMQATPSLLLSAEGYYKRLTDLTVPIWSTLAAFTTTLTNATGDVYGLDLRAEWQHGNFYGFVGYALSDVTYHASQDNFGVWFGEPVQSYHPPHDQRHQVTALASTKVGGFNLSARWQFGSGLPYTQPIGFDNFVPLDTLRDLSQEAGAFRLIFNKPYRGRLPTFHRLDLTAERVFRQPWGEVTAQVGAFNAYDRRNLFYFDIFTARRVDQLPLIPFAGLKVRFL